jgi:hypothetical protein
MSAVKGVNYTKFDAGTYGDNWIDQAKIKTGVKVWTDSYEASALETSSTIAIAELPDGAIVLEVTVISDDLGSTVTISAGDSDEAARYIAATSVTAANDKLELSVVGGLGYVIGTNDGDNTVLLTTAGILGGTISTKVLYSV